MRRTVLLSSLLVCMSVFSNARTTQLTDWVLSGGETGREYPAKVPATVAGVLSRNGVFGGHIMEGNAYFSLDRSIFDKPWTFTTAFDAPHKNGETLLLVFNGLNYYADIVLNGCKIADSDTTFGVFVRRTYDITSLARKSGNTLSVTLRRALKERGDLNIGFVDWNPRPVDESMGIVNTVVLKTVGKVSLEDAYVEPDLDVNTLESADLRVSGRLTNYGSRAVKGVLKIECDNRSESIPMTVPCGGTQFSLDAAHHPVLHIDKPRIWWTWDLGKPEMYNMKISFTANDRLSDECGVDFGIRSITSEITGNNYRQFYLNGRRILVKGAGWTDDIFLRDTRERNRIQTEYVRDMNLNCIRFENIWGKDDNIYDLCDSLGLLAMVGWSCQWEWEDYCGRPEYKHYGCINDEPSMALAARYFRDQVIRFHNHPSIICWLTGSDRIPNPELEKMYMDIYKKYDYRPYVCSAKSIKSRYGGWSGSKMEGPYEYVGPDYWYLDTENGGAFGFNTETGVGMNIPQLPSLERMLGKDKLWPINDVWSKHCTASSSAMNSPEFMTELIGNIYGQAADVTQYVNRAHALDYDATRSMFEAFRCNVPVSTGIIQWMLNSAWPSLYWQLYDWYLVPTAAYYATKKACEKVQLIFNYRDNSVYAVNSSGADVSATARIRTFDCASKCLTDRTFDVLAKDNEPVRIADVDRAGGVFLALELTGSDGKCISDNFYCIPSKCNDYDWKNAKWYYTPIREYADMSFVSELPKAEVTMNVSKAGDIYTVRLHNCSATISYQNILQLFGSDDKLVAPAFWSDNFISLLPGQTRTVTCRCSASGDVKVQTWNTDIVLEQTDTRDRSRYANDSFRDDDRYKLEVAYTPVHVEQVKGKKVKNVIFMVGDGMGLEQISTGWVLNGGALNLDNFLYTGFSRTYAVDKLITDSCAGGTALGTGVKTKYGYMGLAPDGNPGEPTLRVAQNKGMKTGIIATCRLNDATPVDFFGHAKSRDDEGEVAAQYVDSGINFIAGGGIRFWRNREDGRDLVAEMIARGYEFATDNEGIEAAQGDKVLALMAETEMAPALERDNFLERATMKAIETLDNKKGFFLMVEGSCIDDWGHRQKVGHMAEELLDFDRTIGKVLEWAQKDGQTLVVVTADHNTGGLTLIKGSLEDRSVKVHFSTKGHNGIAVPVFAYGPRAEEFIGIRENAEVGQLVKKLLQ